MGFCYNSLYNKFLFKKLNEVGTKWNARVVPRFDESGRIHKSVVLLTVIPVLRNRHTSFDITGKSYFN